MRDVGMNAGAKQRGTGLGYLPRAAAISQPVLRETIRWSALAGVPAAMTVLLSADIATHSASTLPALLPPVAALTAIAFVSTRRAHVASRALAGLVPVALAATLASTMLAPALVPALMLMTLSLFALVCGARLCDLAPRPQQRRRFAMSLITGVAIGGGVAAMLARETTAGAFAFLITAIAGLMLLPAAERVRASLLRARAWTLGILIVTALGLFAVQSGMTAIAELIRASALALTGLAAVKAQLRGVPALALAAATLLIATAGQI